MMKHGRISEVVGAVSLLAMVSAPALAETHKANLKGFQEVPAISTTGEGRCKAKISSDETTIEYKLSYSSLEGGAIQQAHIHFGQKAVNGGVVVFLCTNTGGPVGTPACPPSPGTVTGTILADDIIGPAGQGIAAGELLEAIDAMRAGKTYCNLHTATYPNGEIRGQVK